VRRAVSLAAALSLAAGGGLARPALAQHEGVAPPRPPADQPVEATKLDKVPKQTKFVEAKYPKEAADENIEADVVLMLDINDSGKIDAVGIAEPAGGAAAGLGFDEAAMAAAQGFEFEPAEMGGKPIAVQIQYRYKFRLAAKAPPEAAAPDGGAPPDAGASPASSPATAAVPPRAPVVNFTGRLIERGTRLPIAEALVTVFREVDGKPVGFESPSDATGAFRFFDLSPGEWKVQVDTPGYYPYRTTEIVRAGEAIEAVYHVEKGSYNPYDVTVTATRPRKEVSRTVLAAAEIDKVPGTAGDPLAVIQNFAGVARAPLAGVLIIRGAAPEDSRVFVDGAEVPLIYHFGGLRSVIPVGILDSIEFYPGNFSPMYGRATGGIVDVQIKKLQPKKVGGYADISLLDSGVYLEAPLGDKGAIAIAGRRSYIDVILNAAVPGDASVGLTTAPRYYDFQLVASYRPKPAHDLRFFFLGSDDRLELLFRNPADIDTGLTGSSLGSSTSFYRSLTTWRYVPSPSFENTFRISQGRNWFKFNAGQLGFDLNLYTSHLRDTARTRWNDRFALSFGADVLFGKSDLFVKLPRPPKEGEPMGGFDPSETLTTELDGQVIWSPAVFAELEWKPLPKLLVLPGLRVDYFQRVDELAVQPRLTARWEVVPGITVKGGAGLFIQEPDFDETDPVFGNPDLETERALHTSAGVEWKPRPHLSFDGTLFYKDLANLVSRTERLTTDGAGMMRPLNYDNGGSGRVYGAELVARHEFNANFTGWLAYTVSRALRRDTDASEDRLFDFDQTHILTAVGSYLLPRNWQIGARFRLVSGNPITPIVGSVFNADQDEYYPVYGRINSARNPLFQQLDVRIDKRWIYKSWVLNIYLDVQNIYNHANVEGLNYNYDFSESQRNTGMPIFPILGVRAEL